MLRPTGYSLCRGLGNGDRSDEKPSRHRAEGSRIIYLCLVFVSFFVMVLYYTFRKKRHKVTAFFLKKQIIDQKSAFSVVFRRNDIVNRYPIHVREGCTQNAVF